MRVWPRFKGVAYGHSGRGQILPMVSRPSGRGHWARWAWPPSSYGHSGSGHCLWAWFVVLWAWLKKIVGVARLCRKPVFKVGVATGYGRGLWTWWAWPGSACGLLAMWAWPWFVGVACRYNGGGQVLHAAPRKVGVAYWYSGRGWKRCGRGQLCMGVAWPPFRPHFSPLAEPEPPPSLHPGALLYWGAQHRRLPAMADALAHGADPGWANAAEEHRTPLLQAVAAVIGGGGWYHLIGIPVWGGGGVTHHPDNEVPPSPMYRTRCWAVSSCCRTVPVSIRGTAMDGGRCITPPCWGTLG